MVNAKGKVVRSGPYSYGPGMARVRYLRYRNITADLIDGIVIAAKFELPST